VGISRAQAAQYIGISYQQMQKYEYGDNRISAAWLHILANLHQTPIDRFYGPEKREYASRPLEEDLREQFRQMNKERRGLSLDMARVVAGGIK